jgi:hypothetical protein
MFKVGVQQMYASHRYTGTVNEGRSRSGKIKNATRDRRFLNSRLLKSFPFGPLRLLGVRLRYNVLTTSY